MEGFSKHDAGHPAHAAAAVVVRPRGISQPAARCGVGSIEVAKANGPALGRRAAWNFANLQFATPLVLATPPGPLARKAQTCPPMPIRKAVAWPIPTPQI